jgi:hypothetical protein
MEKKNLLLKTNLFLIVSRTAHGNTLLDAKTSGITVAKVFVSYMS